MEARVVLVTCPDALKAEELAEAMVARRLAACVNIIPQVRSVYTWQGRIEREAEALMVIKTTVSKLAELERETIALHPYEIPEFVVISPEAVNAKYLAWLVAGTAS